MNAGPVNMSPPNRKRRENSPFADDQEIWIIIKYSTIRKIIQVRRSFRSRYEVLPANLPPHLAFKHLIDMLRDYLSDMRLAADNVPGAFSAD